MLSIKIRDICEATCKSLHCYREETEEERDSSSSNNKCRLVFQLGEGFGV